MHKKAQGCRLETTGGNMRGLALKGVASLEALAVFQSVLDKEYLRSLHVYNQGNSLFSIQQNLLLTPTTYCVLHESEQQTFPSWPDMATFVEDQKTQQVAEGWLCILDFAVYAPLPATLSPLLSPGRNPFLSLLPLLLQDLLFVEAVITQGTAQGGRDQGATFGHNQSLSSASSACISDSQAVPFIGSRSQEAFPLPSPRESHNLLVECLRASQPFASATQDATGWMDVASFSDLLASPVATPRMQQSAPLGLCAVPGLPDERSEISSGHFEGDCQLPNTPLAALGLPSSREKLPRGQLYAPPGGFQGQTNLVFNAYAEPSLPDNFVPFVPSFASGSLPDPDRKLELFQQQLAFIAGHPSYAAPGITPGQIFEGAQERARPQSTRLHLPPPRLEVPDANKVEAQSRISRSGTTWQGDSRPPAAFNRAVSGNVDMPLLELGEPALLSPFRDRGISSEGDPSTSLWVCINAAASEGVRPGVSLYPPPPIHCTLSGGSNSSVGTSAGDQMCFEEDPSVAEKDLMEVAFGSSRSPLRRSLSGPGRVETPGPEEQGSVVDSEMATGEEPPGPPSKKKAVPRDPRKATERMSRMTLEELQNYFGMSITDAADLLGVGLTVLKKRCREFGIARWPHRKIKSLDGLIRTIKELARSEDGQAAAPIGHAIQRLVNEKETMEKAPSVAMAQDTKKLRQACFKANFKIRSLAAGRDPRGSRRRAQSASRSPGSPAAEGTAGEETTACHAAALQRTLSSHN